MPRLASVAIFSFLLVQTAVPLDYYLGSKPYDERFAWRMFSPLRLARCNLSFWTVQDGEPLVVDPTWFVHPLASGYMRQGNSDGVDRFAELWCSRNPGAALYTAHTCARPESLELTVCNAEKTELADVLDAYERDWPCRNSSPEICLERDCGSRDIEQCIRRHCLVRQRPRHQDMCERR